VAKFRSIAGGAASRQFRGHHPQALLDLKDTAEAEEFWNILPKRADGPAQPKHEAPSAPPLSMAA